MQETANRCSGRSGRIVNEERNMRSVGKRVTVLAAEVLVRGRNLRPG